MTDPFILERAKVLHGADTSTSIFVRWDTLPPSHRVNNIAMALASAEHDKAKGRKVVEREPTEQMRKAWADRDYSNAAPIHYGVAFDAAPPWPGEGQ